MVAAEHATMVTPGLILAMGNGGTRFKPPALGTCQHCGTVAREVTWIQIKIEGVHVWAALCQDCFLQEPGWTIEQQEMENRFQTTQRPKIAQRLLFYIGFSLLAMLLSQ